MNFGGVVNVNDDTFQLNGQFIFLKNHNFLQSSLTKSNFQKKNKYKFYSDFFTRNVKISMKGQEFTLANFNVLVLNPFFRNDQHFGTKFDYLNDFLKGRA